MPSDPLSPLTSHPQVSSIRMQGLLLLVYVKHLHLPYVRDLRTSYTRTGMYGYWVRPALPALAAWPMGAPGSGSVSAHGPPPSQNIPSPSLTLRPTRFTPIPTDHLLASTYKPNPPPLTSSLKSLLPSTSSPIPAPSPPPLNPIHPTPTSNPTSSPSTTSVPLHCPAPYVHLLHNPPSIPPSLPTQGSSLL